MHASLDLSAGHVFAEKFRIIEPLVRGVLGAVYVAEELSSGRRRALKLLEPGAVADDAHSRFEEQVRASSLIPSEHVVDVIAAGIEGPERVPWVAMELLGGEALDEYCERLGALSLNQTYAITFELCQALAAAHELGIVHAGLRPNKIFLANLGAAGAKFTVKVLDFGLVNPLQAPSAGPAAIDELLWLAPEQVTDGQSIAFGTDVWALGLLVFRLLSGRDYFRAAHGPESALREELLREELPKASERTRKLGAAPVPEGFDDWFARCVARPIGERFSQAQQAWQALHPLLVNAGATPRAPQVASARRRREAPRIIESKVGPDSSGKTLISRSDADLRRSSNPELQPDAVAEVRISSSPELRGSRPSLLPAERAAGGVLLFGLIFVLLLGAASALWLKHGKHRAESPPAVPSAPLESSHPAR